MLRDLGFAKTAMEDRMMEEFGRVADSIGETGGRPLDVSNYVMPCAFNNIVSFFYGRQLTHDDPTRRELHRVMKRVSLAMYSGPFHQFLPWKLRKLLSYLPFTRNHRIAESLAQLEAVSEYVHFTFSINAYHPQMNFTSTMNWYWPRNRAPF
ncbi:uncharacterized protein LOC119459206 [Dermacentor silvarum]|uniref:uncharacterized protein LOC119459206 n=1 Tax=Dermacentor silvarum TaxID=543639 RepID=UPI0021009018|nr:uncharacterized protein LOC119459206 [Dermacentor silvarum]